jgi:uncharacterized protein (DUF58 family)
MATDTAADDQLLDRRLLARLGALALKAPRVFPGSGSGNRSSKARGAEGMEFADHKEYSPGDDFRNIDWNVYARLDELVVKNFETEEVLRVHVLVDTSASMGFGAPAKSLCAKRLAAALAWLGYGAEDWTGVYTFADDLRDEYAPAGKPKSRMMLDLLARSECSGATDLERTLKAFTIKQSRIGLAFIISDFWSSERIDPGLKHLVNAGFSVVGLHVVDPDEESPPIAGDMDVVDLETGEEVPLTAKPGTLAAYQEAFKAHCRAIEGAFALYGQTYLKVPTRDPIEKSLIAALARKRLIRER